VDTEQPIGQALSRDISRGENVALELDRFISVRHERRVSKEDRERAQEEAWAESTRRHNAAREAELKAAWCEYHREQSRRHRATLEALATEHEQRAEELMGGGDAA